MVFVLEQSIDTQEMLESISQSFITRAQLITDNWWVWLTVVVFIISMIVLLFLIKKKTPVAYFITRNFAFGKKLLTDAKEQATLCDVQIQFLEELHVVPMKIMEITEKSFTVQATKEIPLENIQVLENTYIHCSILSSIKNEQGYYMFCSKVLHVGKVNETIELILSLPNKVEKIQRREHLRIEPRDEYILGIALWSEKVVNGAFVNKPELWGEPEYKYIPGKVNQVRLMNISASGAKMLIGVDASNPKLTLDKKCIMLIDIWEPELEQKVRYWIRCVEQNLFKIKDKHAIEIGVRFKEWTTTPLHDDSLHFVLISKYGEIPPLANWIMKRYLEQYKDNAIAEVRYQDNI